MPESNTLINLGIQGLTAVPEQIREQVEPLKGIKEELRKTLLDAGKIIPLGSNPLDLETHPLTAVDGASVGKMQSYFDIISVTAAIAEGNKHQHIYTDKNYPGIAYSTLRQHSSEIDSSGIGLLRSTAELMMLNKTEGYANIIDGSWVSNLTSLLIDMTRKKNATSYTNSIMLFDFLLDQRAKGWDAEVDLLNAVDRLINPQDYDDKHNYIALSKSDSSSRLSAVYQDLPNISPFLKHFLRTFSVKDRVLADLALEPGEMLVPEPVFFPTIWQMLNMANADESNGFEALRASRWTENSDEYKYLNRVLFGLLDTMPGSSLSNKAKAAQLKKSQENEDDPATTRIWNVFIKPTINSRVLKVEFSRGFNTNVEKKAQDLAYVLDQDMVQGIKEPYAQYLVDRRVKQVSVLSDLFLKNIQTELKQQNYESSIIQMLSGGYRT